MAALSVQHAQVEPHMVMPCLYAHCLALHSVRRRQHKYIDMCLRLKPSDSRTNARPAAAHTCTTLDSFVCTGECRMHAAHTNLEEVANARELSIVDEADALPLLPWAAGWGVWYSGCSLSCPVSSSLDGYGLPTEGTQAAQPNAAKPPCSYSMRSCHAIHSRHTHGTG